MGDYRKAIKYLEKNLEIAIELGDRGGMGKTYRKLGIAYQSLGDYRKAIEYVKKHLKIAIGINDRAGEGRDYVSMKDVLYEVRCLKSNEDMILALAGQLSSKCEDHIFIRLCKSR